MTSPARLLTLAALTALTVTAVGCGPFYDLEYRETWVAGPYDCRPAMAPPAVCLPPPPGRVVVGARPVVVAPPRPSGVVVVGGHYPPPRPGVVIGRYVSQPVVESYPYKHYSPPYGGEYRGPPAGPRVAPRARPPSRAPPAAPTATQPAPE